MALAQVTFNSVPILTLAISFSMALRIMSSGIPEPPWRTNGTLTREESVSIKEKLMFGGSLYKPWAVPMTGAKASIPLSVTSLTASTGSARPMLGLAPVSCPSSIPPICPNSASTAAPCGGKSDTTTVDQSDAKGQEQITITFVNWASAEEATKQLTLDMISEFEKQNPTIKVKNVPMPFSDVLNQLTIMNNAGNAPDIAQITNGDGMSLAYMGALEPTDNLLSEGFKADLNKTVYDLGLKDNQHYIIPWAGQPMGFWYNKKLMQDAGLDPNNPPQTLDELNKVMDIAKQKLPKSVVMLQIDTTIRTSLAESVNSHQDLHGLIVVQGTFCDASLILNLASNINLPIMIWATKEQPTGGRLSLNSFCGLNLGAHTLVNAGIKFKGVYGSPGSPAVMIRPILL